MSYMSFFIGDGGWGFLVFVIFKVCWIRGLVTYNGRVGGGWFLLYFGVG